jgi:hypothetical protein
MSYLDVSYAASNVVSSQLLVTTVDGARTDQGSWQLYPVVMLPRLRVNNFHPSVAGCEMEATVGSSVPQRPTEGVVSVESESVVIQILREVLDSFLL